MEFVGIGSPIYQLRVGNVFRAAGKFVIYGTTDSQFCRKTFLLIIYVL